MPVNITPFLTPYTSPADWSKIHATQANNFAEQMQGLMRLQAQKEQNRQLAEQARLEREETARWHTGQLERFKRDAAAEEDEKDRKAIYDFVIAGAYGKDQAEAEARRLELAMRKIRVKGYDDGRRQDPSPNAAPGGVPADLRPPMGPAAPVGATGIPDELRPPAGPAAPPGAVGVPPELRPPTAVGGMQPIPAAPLDSGPPAPVPPASPQELPPEPIPPAAAPPLLLPGQPIPSAPPQAAPVAPQSVTGVTVSPQTPAGLPAAAPPAPAPAAVAPAAPAPLLPGQPIPSTPPTPPAVAPSPAPAPSGTMPGELPDLGGYTKWLFEREGRPPIVLDVGRIRRLLRAGGQPALDALARGARPKDRLGQQAVNEAVSMLPLSPADKYKAAEAGGRHKADLGSREERAAALQVKATNNYNLQLQKERRAERWQRVQRKGRVDARLNALRTSNKLGAESEAYKTLRDQFSIMQANDSKRDLRSYNVAGTAVARMYDSGALNEGDIRRAMGDPSLFEQLKMFFSKQLADKVSPDQWNKMRDYIKQLMETKNNDMRESYRRVAAMRDGYPRGSPEYEAYQEFMKGQYSHANWFAEQQREEGNDEDSFGTEDEEQGAAQPGDEAADGDAADAAGDVDDAEFTPAALAALSDQRFREVVGGESPPTEQEMADWDEEDKARGRMVVAEWNRRFGKSGAPKGPAKKGGAAAPKKKTAAELLETDMPE